MKQFIYPSGNYLSRRDFLKIVGGFGLSATGVALLDACGVGPSAFSSKAEMLETTAIRLGAIPSICFAPQYLAEDFLKEDGFTDIQYIKMPSISVTESLASGALDISMGFSGPLIIVLDTAESVVMLSGIHVGCFVLFGSEQVNTIQDLKGKSVGITGMGTSEHIFVSSMVAYVGLDPNQDINWAVHPLAESKQFFTDGKLDAFLAFPPIAQELRAKQIGHVIVDSMMDDPWSGYFCCVTTANRAFARKNPVATKRTLRALFKATDICAREPERAAKFMVDKGYTENYDYALDAMKQIPYNVWRDYDPEDTVRFYALRLREAGMIKSSPEEIIKQGTDWTFLNELKVELKG
jgi:NitT/TauT family transport system substrate-binding protein